MPMKYKPDWEATQQRLRAWWNHESFGRCALAVWAPLANPPEGKAPQPRTRGNQAGAGAAFGTRPLHCHLDGHRSRGPEPPHHGLLVHAYVAG